MQARGCGTLSTCTCTAPSCSAFPAPSPPPRDCITAFQSRSSVVDAVRLALPCLLCRSSALPFIVTRTMEVAVSILVLPLLCHSLPSSCPIAVLLLLVCGRWCAKEETELVYSYAFPPLQLASLASCSLHFFRLNSPLSP